MTADACCCPRLADRLRSELEGVDVPACPVHDQTQPLNAPATAYEALRPFLSTDTTTDGPGAA